MWLTSVWKDILPMFLTKGIRGNSRYNIWRNYSRAFSFWWLPPHLLLELHPTNASRHSSRTPSQSREVYEEGLRFCRLHLVLAEMSFRIPSWKKKQFSFCPMYLPHILNLAGCTSCTGSYVQRYMHLGWDFLGETQTHHCLLHRNPFTSLDVDSFRPLGICFKKLVFEDSPFCSHLWEFWDGVSIQFDRLFFLSFAGKGSYSICPVSPKAI